MGTAALRWGCRPYAMPRRGRNTQAWGELHPWERSRTGHLRVQLEENAPPRAEKRPRSLRRQLPAYRLQRFRQHRHALAEGIGGRHLQERVQQLLFQGRWDQHLGHGYGDAGLRKGPAHGGGKEVSGSNSTNTYGSENSASWRLEQVPVNTEDPVKTYPMPPCRRLLCYPGVLRDAQDISAQYFNALR
jgi:hypothetical protein